VSIYLKRGFTLLELLVSLVIISLMTAVVGFSVMGHEQRSLKSEGDQLAAKLNAAQLHMAAGASALRLIRTDKGYAFEEAKRATDGTAQMQWQLLINDDVFGEHNLPKGIALRTNEPILIAAEPIGLPAEIYLVHEQTKLRVATDGVQGWLVQ
jgi:type II secretion system protein H